MTKAWISMPPPITTPMVPLLEAAGGAISTLQTGLAVVGPQTSSVTVFFSPVSVSQATPASTYGRTILLGNLYLATSGNSQFPDDPTLVTAFPTDPSTLV